MCKTIVSASVLICLLAAGCQTTADSSHAQIPPGAKIEEIKGDTPNAAMHVVAGDLALNQGNRDEAIRQYQRALLQEPKHADALFKLGTLYVYGRDFDSAIRTWERYVDATGQSAEAYSNLGRAHELAGNWKEAEVNYLKAIQTDPRSRSARVNYGIQLAKRDRLDEAETQLNTVLTPAEVQYNLGSVFELRKNYVAAKVAYAKAIDLDGKLVAARQRLELLNKQLSSTDD